MSGKFPAKTTPMSHAQKLLRRINRCCILNVNIGTSGAILTQLMNFNLTFLALMITSCGSLTESLVDARKSLGLLLVDPANQVNGKKALFI